MKKNIKLYLVSDSTGETVISIAKAAVAHFNDLKAEEHLWGLVRTKGQIDKFIRTIQKDPGIVMFTIANDELQDYLRKECVKLGVLAIPVLAEVVTTLSIYLGLRPESQPGRQHKMDDEYFSRINAINFSLSHDDGQGNNELDKADIIILGPSRTSKSPTCVYLSYRGYKAANVPIILGQSLPKILEELSNPLIVGLTIDPRRLVEIRKNRLINILEKNHNDYVDYEFVEQEVLEAKKLYKLHNWAVIDVTRKSVEETAANIIKLYENKKSKVYEEKL